MAIPAIREGMRKGPGGRASASPTPQRDIRPKCDPSCLACEGLSVSSQCGSGGDTRAVTHTLAVLGLRGDTGTVTHNMAALGLWEDTVYTTHAMAVPGLWGDTGTVTHTIALLGLWGDTGFVTHTMAAPSLWGDTETVTHAMAVLGLWGDAGSATHTMAVLGLWWTLAQHTAISGSLLRVSLTGFHQPSSFSTSGEGGRAGSTVVCGGRDGEERQWPPQGQPAAPQQGHHRPFLLSLLLPGCARAAALHALGCPVLVQAQRAKGEECRKQSGAGWWRGGDALVAATLPLPPAFPHRLLPEAIALLQGNHKVLTVPSESNPQLLEWLTQL